MHAQTSQRSTDEREDKRTQRAVLALLLPGDPVEPGDLLDGITWEQGRRAEGRFSPTGEG